MSGKVGNKKAGCVMHCLKIAMALASKTMIELWYGVYSEIQDGEWGDGGAGLL